VCKQCTQAGLTCEGYETRLTWGPTDTTTPGTGIVLNPVRQTRLQRRLRRRRVTDVLPDNRLELPPGISDLRQIPSPDQLDLLYLQYGTKNQVGTGGLPGDEISEKLKENCKLGSLLCERANTT
jgi:hypothetical protein